MKQFAELSMIDPDTGEIREHLCPDCSDKARHIRTLEADLEATQDKLTQVLRENKALRTRNAKADARVANREQINEMGEIWRELLNKKRCKVREGGARFDALRKLLADGYTVEEFRVACLGAAHNHPWPPHFSKNYRTEIETICRDKNIEIFHDAGCDWLEAQGHEVPERFCGPANVIARVRDAFHAANMGFELAPDGRSGSALCPVSIEGLQVTTEGRHAVFTCKSGCSRDQILGALRVRGWKP